MLRPLAGHRDVHVIPTAELAFGSASAGAPAGARTGLRRCERSIEATDQCNGPELDLVVRHTPDATTVWVQRRLRRAADWNVQQLQLTLSLWNRSGDILPSTVCYLCGVESVDDL